MKMSHINSVKLLASSIDSPINVLRTARALFWRVAKKTRLVRPSSDTIEDQSKDRNLPFDEYPQCEMCGNKSNSEVLVARDGSRIVQCDQCGLWFTSPRVDEELWLQYLQSQDNERNVEFTNNRINYGVALSGNIKYVLPGWRKIRTEKNQSLLRYISKHTADKVGRLHDVGCGVGYLLQDAKDMGIEVSGNELNGYACKVMNTRYGLNVQNCSLENINLDYNSLDIITMVDVIEHTYHPFADMQSAFRLLKPAGLIYIQTFHVNCMQFERFKSDWKMLFWNHVYHFSKESLASMILKAGFHVDDINVSYKNGTIEVLASKPIAEQLIQSGFE